MKAASIVVTVLAWVAPAVASPGVGAAECRYAMVFYSDRSGNKDVWLLRPGGREPRNLTNHPAADLCPPASPDGKRIAFLSDRGGNMDVYVMKTDGSGVRRVAFMSNRDSNYEIYTMAMDGSGQTRLTRTPEWEGFPTWSPDGKEIAYSRKFRADGRMQGMIRVMGADSSSDRELTQVETRDENAMWSPDGIFIVFQSVRDGNFEVYRMRRDGSDPVRLTDHPGWDRLGGFRPRQNEVIGASVPAVW